MFTIWLFPINLSLNSTQSSLRAVFQSNLYQLPQFTYFPASLAYSFTLIHFSVLQHCAYSFFKDHFKCHLLWVVFPNSSLSFLRASPIWIQSPVHIACLKTSLVTPCLEVKESLYLSYPLLLLSPLLLFQSPTGLYAPSEKDISISVKHGAPSITSLTIIKMTLKGHITNKCLVLEDTREKRADIWKLIKKEKCL